MQEFRVSSLRMEPAHTGSERLLERFAGLQPYVWNVWKVPENWWSTTEARCGYNSGELGGQ